TRAWSQPRSARALRIPSDGLANAVRGARGVTPRARRECASIRSSWDQLLASRPVSVGLAEVIVREAEREHHAARRRPATLSARRMALTRTDRIVGGIAIAVAVVLGTTVLVYLVRVERHMDKIECLERAFVDVEARVDPRLDSSGARHPRLSLLDWLPNRP